MKPLSAFALVVCAVGLGAPAGAQPEPSFRASCETLRQSLDALKDSGELVTIAIEDSLTMAKSGAGLTYLGLCTAPAPQVLCVTYQGEARKVGDRVLVSGTLERVGPDHVKLDPCIDQVPE